MIAMLFAGCSKEEQPQPQDPQIGITGFVEATRTSISGTTASFISGDQIGIRETLTNRNNVRFTYNGTTWSTTTPMYWYNAISTHTFYAYWPYNSSSSGSRVSIPILSNQTITTTIAPAYDMLVTGAKTQKRTDGTNVPLQFRHAFALLQFNITMGVLNTWTIKTMTIQGGNTSGGATNYGIVNKVNDIDKVAYNLTSGTATFVDSENNTSSVFSQTLTKNIPSVGLIGAVPITIYAIILPGQYSNPVPAIQFVLTPLIGSDKTTTLVSLPNTTFVGNTKYTYNVQIGGGLITTTAPDPELSAPLPLTIKSSQFNTISL